MTNRRIRRVLVASLLLSIAAAVAYAGSDFLSQPTWKPVKSDAVFTRLEEYLRTKDIAPAVQTEVRDRWRAAGTEAGSDLLTRLAQSLAKADDRVAELVTFCSGTSQRGQKLPEFAWLADSDTPELVRFNMRLFYSRWLVQQGYYDEAISWTDGLKTDEVVAPKPCSSTEPLLTINSFSLIRRMSRSANCWKDRKNYRHATRSWPI